MATKVTPKQEKFAQNIVKGMSQADAYRNSFNVKPNTKDETCHNSGYKMMQKGEVRERIEELRAPVIKKLQYGLEEAMIEAQEAFNIAKGKENGGAMVAAATLRAKLNGLLIDRAESKVTVHESSLDELA